MSIYEKIAKMIRPFFLYLCISLVIQSIFMIADKKERHTLLLTLIIGAVNFAVFLFLFLKEKIEATYKKNFNVYIAVLIAIMGILACIGLNCLFDSIGINKMKAFDSSTLPSVKRMAAYALYAVIFAPVTEEIVFRGFMYGRGMKDGLKSVTAFIISSGAFALIHGSPAQALYAFIIAFFLCMVYNKTRTIVAPVIFHVSANLCVVYDNFTGFVTTNTAGIRLFTAIASLLLLWLFVWVFGRYVRSKERRR